MFRTKNLSHRTKGISHRTEDRDRQFFLSYNVEMRLMLMIRYAICGDDKVVDEELHGLIKVYTAKLECDPFATLSLFLQQYAAGNGSTSIYWIS